MTPKFRPVLKEHNWMIHNEAARRTTQESVQSFLDRELVDSRWPAHLRFWMGGELWPTIGHLNRITLSTGLSGSGKTAAQKIAMWYWGQLFYYLETMRGIVVDVTPNAEYLEWLYRILPPDVEIIRAAPQDPYGQAWDIAGDIKDFVAAGNIPAGLFPEDLIKGSSDPFWYNKAKELLLAVIKVFLTRCDNWTFPDLCVPFVFPQYLRPLLEHSPLTRGMVEQDLTREMGQGIIAAGGSIMNKMETAAAMMQRAKKRYRLDGPDGILNKRCVVYWHIPPDTMEAVTPLLSIFLFVAVKLALKRRDPSNFTHFWLDEFHYLHGLLGLDEAAAFGRGSGLGMYISTQNIPALIRKFGEQRTKELLALVANWQCFQADYDTALAFSQRVGQYVAYQKSTTETKSTGTSRGGEFRGSWNGYVPSWTQWGDSTGYSFAESWALHLKNAVEPGEITNLPGPDIARDRLYGMFFNPDAGCYSFETPFIKVFDKLPKAPFSGAPPMRPADEQVLRPWRVEDIVRMGLNVEKMAEAMRTTDGKKGGR